MALNRHWQKYVIVISILAHIRTIYTKPISVPVVWPDSPGGSINSNRESFNPPNRINRRIETINQRPNSDFNRLVFNHRIGHNLQNENSQDSVDYVDRPERLTNNFAVQGGNQQNNNKFVFDDVESRTKFLFKKKLKKKKKKICLPVNYGYGKAESLRTLYDINVLFADVNVNGYDAVGGYGCKPLFGFSSGHGGGHGSHGGHGSSGGHGSLGGHGSNHHTSSHQGSTTHGGSTTDTDTDTDGDYDYSDENDHINQNDHGSLVQTDDYESNSPSQSSHGSNNLFGGLFHGTTSGSNNNGHASGGPLGFFGQGGLFDFSNNGGQRPQSDSTLGDSTDDTRPVIEINVPDTIQDVVQGNWRPGNLVGGIQNSVSGFIQQISDRPGETIRQINREISSIFRSFTDFF